MLAFCNLKKVFNSLTLVDTFGIKSKHTFRKFTKNIQRKRLRCGQGVDSRTEIEKWYSDPIHINSSYTKNNHIPFFIIAFIEPVGMNKYEI